MLKNTFDDGFNLELVETAYFDGILEIPKIEPPEEIFIPSAMIPFSKRNRSKVFSECVVFYEHDKEFAELVRKPEDFLDDLLRFPAVVTPDNSIYRDSPLIAQIANVYRSRAIGHHLQKNGAYVITNVRWGDERSYTTDYLPEKFAFLGAPKNSIVSIGTYGCIRGKENKYFFRAGLEAMLDELTPEVVLVYGRMPDSIFGGLKHKTNFISYPDWISKVRKKVYLMGTGKTGRCLNTHGSARSVSDFALVHSIEGLFTKPMRRRDRLRLKSGGHGQKGMLLLDKYGIEYNIVKTYPNGVRVGNIPDHTNKRKQTGIGQSWFPASWSPNDIRRAGEHVAGLKKNRHVPDGQRVYGMYKGVRVGIIRTHGKIGTVFPDSNQPVKRRRSKK